VTVAGDGGGAHGDRDGMRVRVRVLLFADLAEAAGTRSVELVLPAGESAGGALAALAAGHPAVAERQASIALAVGDRYVDRDAVLHDGDELALIPPVSGG